MHRADTSFFLVICGIDGSGKTTLINRLIQEISGCQFSHWRNLYKLEDKSWLNGFQLDSDASKAADYVHTLSPMQRALYIATSVWVEYENFIKPGLDQGRWVISDSYYYKFWAKEKAFNRAHFMLYDLLSELPEPDQVIMLDADPMLACTRKSLNTSYETSGSSLEERISFQATIRSNLLEVINQTNHTVINANHSTDLVHRDVAKILSRQNTKER